MSKRKFELTQHPLGQMSSKRRNVKFDLKKHSLDSDEEDEHDEAEDELDADDIEGEEDGIARQDGGIRMTAFNMKEEMEEGHFDKNGHFIWNNEKEIRDNWLDNVDWHKITDESKYQLAGGDGNSDSDDDDDDDNMQTDGFNEIEIYKKMIVFMKPKETVNKAIKRLGGDQKLSSIERLKRKKAGTLNNNQDCVDLTEFANTILTKTGNMDIYQETFEEITKKIDSSNKKKAEPVLDMYADDFEDKEKEQINEATATSEDSSSTSAPKVLKWEFKWDQNKDEIEGPYDTKQMIEWAEEGHFKSGVWVRKCGENSNFYSSNRIDFELYE